MQRIDGGAMIGALRSGHNRLPNRPYSTRIQLSHQGLQHPSDPDRRLPLEQHESEGRGEGEHARCEEDPWEPNRGNTQAPPLSPPRAELTAGALMKIADAEHCAENHEVQHANPARDDHGRRHQDEFDQRLDADDDSAQGGRVILGVHKDRPVEVLTAAAVAPQGAAATPRPLGSRLPRRPDERARLQR